MPIPTLNIGHTPNYATVTVGELDLYYSYETVIAFCTPETGLVVRTNDWGPTTGQHLNRIDGGSREAQKRRLSGDAFEKWLTAIVAERDAAATKEATR
jgi:hypothetical protein